MAVGAWRAAGCFGNSLWGECRSVKYVPPSVKETAFNCPHCGALTTQQWYVLAADEVGRELRLPFLIRPAERAAYDFLITT